MRPRPYQCKFLDHALYILAIFASAVQLGRDAGPVGFVPLLAALVMCWFPLEPLEPIPGLLYGFERGFLVLMLGKVLGAFASMLLGRFVLRDYMSGLMKRRFPSVNRVARAVQTEGLGALLLVRLAPMPMAAKNYALSVLDVPLSRALLATSLSLLPQSLFWAQVGSSIGDIAMDESGLSTSELVRQNLPPVYLMVGVGVPCVGGGLFLVNNVRRRFHELKLEEEAELAKRT